MSTFYLKYRPQTVGELDLVSVREQLTQVLQSGNVPHAFLFSGTRGLGKTSAARILAKAVNCEHRTLNLEPRTQNKTKKHIDDSQDSRFKIQGSSFEPCNQCDACISITKGSAMDVVEIDGASNRGIDDVRALREGVTTAPIRLRKKVYVIDEVHMLTKEAFNALLKTLEEPSEHVLFVLATTEPNKVPETVVSRCFHIKFQRATRQEIKDALQKVIKGENLTVSDDVLNKIVDRVKGGFRDSMKMLEQLAFAGKKINSTNFEQIFPQSDVNQLLQYLLNRDGSGAVQWIIQQSKVGVDWEEVVKDVLLILQKRLVQSLGIDEDSDVEHAEIETEIKSGDLLNLIELFIKVSSQIKFAVVQELPIQVAVVRWCGDQFKVKSQAFKVVGARRGLLESSEKQAVVGASHGSPESLEKQDASSAKQNKKQEVKSESAECRVQNTITLEEIVAKWEEFLMAVKPHNHSVAALLKGAVPIEVKDGEVIIKVFYAFHKDRLEDNKSEKIMQECFKQVFASVPKIRYILGEKQEKQQIDAKKDRELVAAAQEIFG